MDPVSMLCILRDNVRLTILERLLIIMLRSNNKNTRRIS